MRWRPAKGESCSPTYRFFVAAAAETLVTPSDWVHKKVSGAFPVGQTLGQTASFRQTAPETWCQSRVCGVSPPTAPKAVKRPVRLWLTWHCPMMNVTL